MKRQSDGTGEGAAHEDLKAGFSRRAVSGAFAAIAAMFAGTSIARAAPATGSRQQFRPVPGVDYATTDSPYYDPDFPPMHFPHAFMSQGRPVQSFMWIANGNEPRGCVILSPQAYGGDSLDSLIPALVGSGLHVLRFNPRGMWDDQVDYTFPGALEDLHSAVAFLRENNGEHRVPPGAGYPLRPFKIDTGRIAVLGKSGGGGMLGWIAAAESPHISTVISVSPAELVLPPYAPEVAKMFSDLKASSYGRIDLLAMLEKLTPADVDRLNMRKAARRLVDKKVLLIGSSGALYVQGIHRPLVQAMENAGAKHFSEVILPGDEYFLTVRVAMARLVVSWLKTECGF